MVTPDNIMNKSMLGWDALNTAITQARVELHANADEKTITDADAYLMRVMTQNLDDAFLHHLFKERGLTRALATKGGPNPDYIMYHAGIDTAGQYQLRGRLNDSERVAVALYAVSTEGVLSATAFIAFDPETVKPDGQFSLEIAADISGPGTLAIEPETRIVMIRVLHRNTQGQPCSLTLDGGSSDSDLALTGGSTEHALTHAGRATLRAIRQYLQWSQMTSANPNRFTPPPKEMADEIQAEPDTSYYLGYYDLQEGECLEVSLKTAMTGYWSLHAYNHWCEALPNAGVDDQTAAIDADGDIRIRIGPSLVPGETNAIDTLGRYRGALILRSIGSNQTQCPQTYVRRDS